MSFTMSWVLYNIEGLSFLSGHTHLDTQDNSSENIAGLSVVVISIKQTSVSRWGDGWRRRSADEDMQNQEDYKEITIVWMFQSYSQRICALCLFFVWAWGWQPKWLAVEENERGTSALHQISRRGYNERVYERTLWRLPSLPNTLAVSSPLFRSAYKEYPLPSPNQFHAHNQFLCVCL